MVCEVMSGLNSLFSLSNVLIRNFHVGIKSLDSVVLGITWCILVKVSNIAFPHILCRTLLSYSGFLHEQKCQIRKFSTFRKCEPAGCPKKNSFFSQLD